MGCKHPTEDSHTAPHAECARPDYWHAPDSDSTECEISELIGSLVRALQPELVVETGSAFGHTALQIGKALRNNGHGRLVSLEVDPQRIHMAQLRTAPYRKFVEIRRQSSLDYLPEDSIGFALFDSLYELRADEFRRYRNHGALPAGTIVAFHDTTSGLRGHYMDVRAEVQALADEGLLVPLFLRTPRGLGICQVR